ncbi:hypothetical protein FI667_g13415, partial [Globisporangium splendens]
MTFEFRSFEHFKQVRAKAAQWRAFDKQLRGAEGEELIRGVLQEPVIDNRTDRDYEKRLYQGFKEGMQRLREGTPLVTKEPPKSPPKDQFREACITLGYLPSSSSALLPPSPSAPPVTYPRVLFLHTPSPPLSPSSMTSSVALLRATPTSPPPAKTPTRIFSPSVSMPSWSPTPPPTPRESQYPAYLDHSSSEEDTWLPPTPSPLRREFEAASFRPAIAEEAEETQNATTVPAVPAVPVIPVSTAIPAIPVSTAAPEATKEKPAPKRRRRKQQPKFSDEALKKVRPPPPATRRSKAQYK